MKQWTQAGCYLVALIGGGLANGQVDDAPIITLTEAERLVEAQVTTETSSTFADDSRTTAGPFVSNVSDSGAGDLGSSGSATAQQDTQISIFSMSGTGSASASAELGGGPDAEADTLGESRLSAEFTIPVDAPWSLTGSFDAIREGGGAQVFGTVAFAGFTPTGVFIHSAGYGPDQPPEERAFIFVGTAAANSALNFGISANAAAFGDDMFGTKFIGEGMASFDFNLDFGDRDGDGLLDEWEENGIDFDGAAPPEIDLPAMGANPDIKDIFVELDVMDGVAFDQAAMDEVIEAFAQAPALAVDNNDGSAGIQLHVLVDGDRPEHAALIGMEGMPAQFYTIKSDYFGSQDDRDHPNWNAIRKAKLLIFGYCLWADTLAIDFTSPPQTIQALGLAEAIPSNDFIVAGGSLASYSDFLLEKRAGTFMHELGHTLGLGHGGQNNENFKPNYLSVMNYAYTLPFTQISAQGTDVGEYWRLDFSRSTMIDLNETALDESRGLGGPPGRVVYFNSADEADPEPVQRTAALGHLPYVNWNANDDQTEGPYQLDITRLTAAADPVYDQTLQSYTDWDRIYYQLAGTADFDDRAMLPFAERSPALEQDVLEAFHNVPWVDLVVIDDLIFTNDFD